MDNSLPEDSQILNEAIGVKLLDSHEYWSRMRLLFNILVGVAGLVPTVVFGFYLSLFGLFGIALWGLVANGLYSLGYVIESFIITKTKGSKSLKRSRSILFWLGTIAYVLVSLAFVYLYYLAPVAQD